MDGSSALEFFTLGHGGKSEHVFLRLMIFFDVGVESGVGEVGFTTGAEEVSTLFVFAVPSGHLFLNISCQQLKVDKCHFWSNLTDFCNLSSWKILFFGHNLAQSSDR